MKQYTVKVYEDRTEWYNEDGKFHRENGPTIEYANGDKYWHLNGLPHREDGPAIEYVNGSKYWYLNGKEYSEADFNAEIAKRKQQQAPSCNGKIVKIDGKEYILTEMVGK